jgi:hypothetical protein
MQKTPKIMAGMLLLASIALQAGIPAPLPSTHPNCRPGSCTLLASGPFAVDPNSSVSGTGTTVNFTLTFYDGGSGGADPIWANYNNVVGFGTCLAPSKTTLYVQEGPRTWLVYINEGIGVGMISVKLVSGPAPVHPSAASPIILKGSATVGSSVLT